MATEHAWPALRHLSLCNCLPNHEDRPFTITRETPVEPGTDESSQQWPSSLFLSLSSAVPSAFLRLLELKPFAQPFPSYLLTNTLLLPPFPSFSGIRFVINFLYGPGEKGKSSLWIMLELADESSSFHQCPRVVVASPWA